MKSKEKLKYVINKSQYMTPYNNNAVYVKTPVKVYSLKGDNVPILLSDIIKEFEHSNDIDSVILNLSDKYSLISLQKMLDFLIENRFLIESLSLEQEVYHDNFAKQIEFFSTFKANPKKIIEQFNHISLGIICSDSLADELLSSVVESGLYSNISIANIDNKNYEFKREEKKQAKIAIDINIVDFNINTSCMIEQVISNSNLVIVALDKYNEMIFSNINSICIEKSIPWIKAVIDGILCEIGPFIIPGQTACHECMNIRRIRNMDDENLIFFEKVFKDDKGIDIGYFYQSIKLTTALLLMESSKYISGLYCALIGRLLIINCISFEFSTHDIIKVYNCPSCLRE